ncbi:MAG: F0F1 ATP synthase subunit A [Eubacterium sp.]|nr:F0F1 ATP synthase subunit A [Eubacterium sp.]
MEEMAEKLVEELECETVFTIPIGDGIAVSESVVVTWIIMAVLILVCFLLTRRMKVRGISRRQAFIETVVVKLTNLTGDMVGERGRGLAPYLTTVLIYISFANICGIFGFKSPTKDMNVTIALAGMSIILVQAAGIYYLGVKGWLKSFTRPVGVILPFNILDILTRPLSLCMRLFGNVLGAFVIMKLIEMVVPVVLPAVLSVYFDLFDGLLQAYVFVFLTSLYIKEAIEEEEEETSKKKKKIGRSVRAIAAQIPEKKSA